jgi:hypothetical protein
MERNFTFAAENKRADERQEKDRLLELISAKMLSDRLGTKELRAIVPTIDAAAVSRLRNCERSAGSVERLRTIAVGLGLIAEDFNPSASAAKYSVAA